MKTKTFYSQGLGLVHITSLIDYKQNAFNEAVIPETSPILSGLGPEAQAL